MREEEDTVPGAVRLRAIGCAFDKIPAMALLFDRGRLGPAPVLLVREEEPRSPSPPDERGGLGDGDAGGGGLAQAGGLFVEGQIRLVKASAITRSKPRSSRDPSAATRIPEGDAKENISAVKCATWREENV